MLRLEIFWVKALNPLAVFSVPTVFANKALDPIAVLWLDCVVPGILFPLLNKAESPMATVFDLDVFNRIALFPIATLLYPVVLLKSVPKPFAV